MDKFINTYTEVKFLEFIFSEKNLSRSLHDILLNDSCELLRFSNIKKLFFNNSYLYLDNPKDIVDASKINPYFSKLIDSANSGKIAISSQNTKLNKNLKIRSSSIGCYINKLETIENIYVTDSQNWNYFIDKISLDHIYTVNKNEKLNSFPGWQAIKNFKLPTNSAIISDRYLLKNEQSFNENLFTLIDNLFFDINSHNTFYLTIITQYDSYNKPIYLYNTIKNFLKKKFRSKPFYFSLFTLKGSECPHDRNILTNYYYINSDNSFDFYNQNGKINTNTFVKFVGLNSDINSFNNLKSQFKSIIKNNKCIGPLNNILAD